MHPGNKRTTMMRTASTSVPLESLAMANIEMFRDKKKTGELNSMTSDVELERVKLIYVVAQIFLPNKLNFCCGNY